ncbi:hypothetical protein QR680_012286 [Steinernema hermaphroditum]|uniref:Uncharacterized protein n=1 Tax=Steinernema hermaphroditum TaxID=289476 RepID=A0AA39I1J0_9BILA|nr:hypothetical protein QR680_012286 [Steinernema hermaphroditum]
MAAVRVVVISFLLLFESSTPLSAPFNDAIQRFVTHYLETKSSYFNDNYIPERLKTIIKEALTQEKRNEKRPKLPKNVEAKISFTFVEGVKEHGDQLFSFCGGRANHLINQIPKYRRHAVTLTPDAADESEIHRTTLSIPSVWLRPRFEDSEVQLIRCIRSLPNDTEFVEFERINATLFEEVGNFVEVELVPPPPNSSFVSIALLLDNRWNNFHLPKEFGAVNLQMDIERYFLKNRRTKACNMYLGSNQPCCLWPVSIHGFLFRRCAGHQNGVECTMTEFEPNLIYDKNGKVSFA